MAIKEFPAYYWPSDFPKNPARVFKNMQELEAAGIDNWVDTPTKLKGSAEAFGITEGDEAHSQAAGAAVEHVLEAVNGSLQIDQMERADLIAWLGKHHPDFKFDKRTGDKVLVSQVKKYLASLEN